MFKNKKHIFWLCLYLCLSIPIGVLGLKKASTQKTSKKIFVKTYQLNIDYQKINITGKEVRAMVVNRSLPAPTLYFQEGQRAVIDVTNRMDVESSIHWHGILLPNFQDGVPHLTTPPILPGQTHRFEFTLKQAGTYWYHSHTGLQEQRGVYGAIVIEPKHKKYRYDHELVLVLSDWTDEDPHEVLRTLKRGNEWYGIKKGSALSLMRVIRENAIGALFKMWSQRMPGVDISDVYYPAFLVNGEKKVHYPFRPKEKIRLRIVNASASTYFWLNFGGPTPLLIAADGQNVRPTRVTKILHAIAETYDFLVTVPHNKQIEIRATAQDTSGFASVTLGEGEVLKAPLVPKINWVQKMKDTAHTHHHHGAGVSHKPSHKPTHKPSHKPTHDNGNTHTKSHKPPTHKHHLAPTHNAKTHNTKMHNKDNDKSLKGYDYLRSLKKSNFSSKKNTLREIHLNLTGNMYRYVWSLNNRVLSQADKIKIKKGERVILHLHNQTMMHHPMHLHGHFFRVLNRHGVYSPLKHTVDVPPMQTVMIEFQPEEKGDWLFHCHVLYHMKSGMSRVFSHDSQWDIRLNPSKLLNADRQGYVWMELGLMGYQVGDMEVSLDMVRSSIKHQVSLSGVVSDGVFSQSDSSTYTGLIDGNLDRLEGELSYEYFVDDFFRLFMSGELEGSIGRNPELDNMVAGSRSELDDWDLTAWLGIRATLPFFLEVELGVNHLTQFRMGAEYEVLLLDQTEFFIGGEWQWPPFNNPSGEGFSWPFVEGEDLGAYEGFLGFRYRINKNVSLVLDLNTDLGWGGGINWQI